MYPCLFLGRSLLRSSFASPACWSPLEWRKQSQGPSQSLGMATRMGPGPTAAAAPRLLPHQLVARDGRSSYIQRVDTLAGPGAYVIPSTFTTPPVNAKMREIHQELFGRDFARHQRQSQMTQQSSSEDERVETDEGAALTKQERRDRYLERRERLRELLQAVGYPDRHSAEPASIASPDSTATSKRSTGSLPLSPSLSCTSNYDVFVAGYRQQQQQQQQQHHGAKSRGSTRSLRSPTSPTSASTYELESVGFVQDSPAKTLSPKPHHQHAAVHSAASAAMTPLSYKDYLATTSYGKRLQRGSPRQPQPSRQASVSSNSSSVNFKPPPPPASSPGNGR